MTQIRRSKTWRRLAWLLTLAVAATLMPVWAVPPAAAEIYPEDVRHFLVMPAVDQTGSGLDYLSKMLTGELVLAIASVKGLAALEFEPNNPSIRRAVSEGRVLPVQVEAGVTTPSAAIQLAQALGLEAVVLTTIENAAWSEHPRQVKLIVSGAVYPVEGNYDAQAREVTATPQTERTFKVVGASPSLAGYTGPDRPLYRDALRDAARQIAGVFVGLTPVSTGDARPTRRSDYSWLAYVVGVGLLALLISNTKSSSKAPGGVLAPVPVRLQVESNGIRLVWQPPPPSDLTVFGYQIQRSFNGGPWQYIDQGQVTASMTQFFDQNLVSGEYRYRIAAVYTNQAVSPFINFVGVSF
ncbi:MAG: fibronectin type III domain-containing protein [candidate division WS1 bacterium]|nr:fibronectin type III domain-containing protein [candidate division WS1 bacterium]